MPQKEELLKKEPDKNDKKNADKPVLPSTSADSKLNAIRESEIKDLLAKSNISLALDDYTDLFSDFDPRPYSERALSDDFLNESRKAARDKPKSIELNFLIPEALRQPAVETKIRKRLKDHFKRHHESLLAEQKSFTKKGIIFVIFGFIFMFTATFLYDLSGFWWQFLRVVIEPSGWFMVWFGLDQLFYNKGQKQPEIDFYGKMSSATVTFSSY